MANGNKLAPRRRRRVVQQNAADVSRNQAIDAEEKRAKIAFMGTAAIAELAGQGFDMSMAQVSAAFIRLLTKQFKTYQFIDGVGRIRLRRLEPITVPLSAAGAFIAAAWTITAPSDRYQLIFQPVIKVQGPDATSIVPYEDMAILTRDAIISVQRPQSDQVDESFDAFSSAGEQMEFDPLTGDPFVEDQVWTMNRAMPHGIPAAIDYAFAGLTPTNTLTLSLNNLANAGALVPSGGDLQATAYFFAMDCIEG